MDIEESGELPQDSTVQQDAMQTTTPSFDTVAGHEGNEVADVSGVHDDGQDEAAT